MRWCLMICLVLLSCLDAYGATADESFVVRGLNTSAEVFNAIKVALYPGISDYYLVPRHAVNPQPELNMVGGMPAGRVIYPGTDHDLALLETTYNPRGAAAPCLSVKKMQITDLIFLRGARSGSDIQETALGIFSGTREVITTPFFHKPEKTVQPLYCFSTVLTGPGVSGSAVFTLNEDREVFVHAMVVADMNPAALAAAEPLTPEVIEWIQSTAIKRLNPLCKTDDERFIWLPGARIVSGSELIKWARLEGRSIKEEELDINGTFLYSSNFGGLVVSPWGEPLSVRKINGISISNLQEAIALLKFVHVGEIKVEMEDGSTVTL